MLTSFFFAHRQMLTGSYHNYFRVYDTFSSSGDSDNMSMAAGGGNDEGIVLQADKAVLRTKRGAGTGAGEFSCISSCILC